MDKPNNDLLKGVLMVVACNAILWISFFGWFKLGMNWFK
jgi:hypothetical protein